jgi:hypothetical protein
MQSEAAAGVAASLHELQHAPGEPRLPRDLHQEGPHRRRQRARLEYHGVAECERGHEMPVGEVCGEVEGPEYRQHPARVHGRAGAGAGLLRGHEAHALAEAHVHLGGDEPSLLPGLPARLADLAGDQVRELFLTRLGAVAEPAQHRGARLEAGGRPARERPTGSRHGGVHGVLVRDLEGPQQVGGVGGRAALEGLRHGTRGGG